MIQPIQPPIIGIEAYHLVMTFTVCELERSTMLLRTVVTCSHHLFRLGPSKNHGSFRVITRVKQLDLEQTNMDEHGDVLNPPFDQLPNAGKPWISGQPSPNPQVPSQTGRGNSCHCHKGKPHVLGGFFGHGMPRDAARWISG